jgi:hypothetical protein
MLFSEKFIKQDLQDLNTLYSLIKIPITTSIKDSIKDIILI